MHLTAEGGDGAMQVLKGMKVNSPRGLIHISPETGDVVQNVYVREAKKVGGKIYNAELKRSTLLKIRASNAQYYRSHRMNHA